MQNLQNKPTNICPALTLHDIFQERFLFELCLIWDQSAWNFKHKAVCVRLIMDPWIISLHISLLLTRLITKSFDLFLELHLSVKAEETWYTWLGSIVAVFHCQSPSFLVLSIFFTFKHLNNGSCQNLLRACVCFTWWLPRCAEACSNGTAQHVAWEEALLNAFKVIKT